jgi:hypothetical protein
VRGAGIGVEAAEGSGSRSLAEAAGPGVKREVTEVGGAAVSETNPAVIARTVETVAPKFSRGYMQSLRSFNPFSDDEPMYLIRLKAADPTQIETAYGSNTAEALERARGKAGSPPRQLRRQDFPFAGNGFTSDIHHVVPEYHTAGAVAAQDGAELIQLAPNGEELLIGIYNEAEGKWLAVAKGWK